MKHKSWPVHIWFLDSDLHKSASYLTSKALLRSIDGCIGAILATYFYLIGIRSKKFYDYYFGKEHLQETMARFFPNWPLSKRPSFAAYGWRESKWCRSCYENYVYCIDYLRVLLDEHEYRDSSQHVNAAFLTWLDLDMPRIYLPTAGISEVQLPWKTIDPKYRRVDTIAGYRLQFMSTFEDDDSFKAYGSCRRDIPAFVLEHFNGSQAYES